MNCLLTFWFCLLGTFSVTNVTGDDTVSGCDDLQCLHDVVTALATKVEKNEKEIENLKKENKKLNDKVDILEKACSGCGGGEVKATGYVLILGGADSSRNYTDSVELFNVDPDAPSDSTCTAVPDHPSNFPSTTIINNNRLLVCGGTSCWTWTPREAGWREAPNLSNLLRTYGQLVSVDGSAFLLGGVTESGISNKIYTTTGQTWKLAGQLKQGRIGFQ